jgi:hypothetical protein
LWSKCENRYGIPFRKATSEKITLGNVLHSAAVLDLQLNEAAHRHNPSQTIPKIMNSTIATVDFGAGAGLVAAAGVAGATPVLVEGVVMVTAAGAGATAASAKLSYNFLAKRRSSILYIKQLKIF